MAKQDNNGQKLFGTEFNGFNKKQVTEYIASLEKKYNDAIRQKTDEATALENSYSELQDKYAELFDSYMVLQDEKAKIADVLIGAENRAAEIVESAKSDAERERAALEAQSEVLREAIVDKNKIIKDLKPYIELSESTLYTILKRLETASMLTVHTTEHNGRLRKYYHITDIGLKRIEDFKNEWSEILAVYSFVTKEDDINE